MCTGEEENLLQCSRVPELNVGESDCAHFEDAGVRCEGRESRIVHLGRPYLSNYGRYLTSVLGLQLLLHSYVCTCLYICMYILV